MKRNLDAALLDLKGNAVKESTPEAKDKPVTIGSLLLQALLTLTQEDQGLSGEEKVTRYKLGLKIAKGGEVDFSTEDLALVKRLVGKLYQPLVVGRVYEWCEETTN